MHDIVDSFGGEVPKKIILRRKERILRQKGMSKSLLSGIIIIVQSIIDLQFGFDGNRVLTLKLLLILTSIVPVLKRWMKNEEFFAEENEPE
jgi:hypothetical protein